MSLSLQHLTMNVWALFNISNLPYEYPTSGGHAVLGDPKVIGAELKQRIEKTFSQAYMTARKSLPDKLGANSGLAAEAFTKDHLSGQVVMAVCGFTGKADESKVLEAAGFKHVCDIENPSHSFHKIPLYMLFIPRKATRLAPFFSALAKYTATTKSLPSAPKNDGLIPMFRLPTIDSPGASTGNNEHVVSLGVANGVLPELAQVAAGTKVVLSCSASTRLLAVSGGYGSSSFPACCGLQYSTAPIGFYVNADRLWFQKDYLAWAKWSAPAVATYYTVHCAKEQNTPRLYFGPTMPTIWRYETHKYVSPKELTAWKEKVAAAGKKYTLPVAWQRDFPWMPMSMYIVSPRNKEIEVVDLPINEVSFPDALHFRGNDAAHIT